MYLLDTCLLSEAIRPAPDSHVDAWIKSQKPESLFASALTCGELRYGIERLPQGRRRSVLEHWFEETILVGLEGRILAFDYKTALCWARLRAMHGHAVTVDSQIGATALAHDLTLVTRNVKDFAFEGLRLLNPWRQRE